MNKNYITAEAYKALTEELNELKTIKRKEIAQMLQDAKELGDLSENAAYQEAKGIQSALETRILQLEIFFKDISIIRHSINNDIVQLGSTIEIKSLTQPINIKVFTIIGSHEAKPIEGKISNLSPLGKAFLGHKKGDIILVNTPQGEVKYKVLKIS
ncbi:MAG TPA: transcription elongation factor GreA [Candidatus Paceibacterota bacterium]|nr:transcription elongation factor GreA [Candidatus Paceibacterota bacterium]